MSLEKEIETYHRELQNLLASEGKFVVIKGANLLGVYDTYQDALHAGYEKCGLGPFLVKKVESIEQAYWTTRDIEPCRT